MSLLSDPALVERFVAALGGNPAFALQARAFDGAIQLEEDDAVLWLKVYKGRVIDHQRQPSAFGYTFKFRGAASAWRALVDGSRTWADLTFPGKRDFSDDPALTRVGEPSVAIRTEGNLLEAGRLTEACFELAYTLRAAAQGA